MPTPLVLTDEMSVIIAMLKETFPLLIPPQILAIINIAKLVETDHSKFETNIPA